MRAVIYARYSTELQSGASVEDQVRICQERIDREGRECVQVFQDRATSGSSSLRPGYQALLAAALDRLSRAPEAIAGLFKRLRFAGVRIMALSESEISELHHLRLPGRAAFGGRWNSGCW